MVLLRDWTWLQRGSSGRICIYMYMDKGTIAQRFSPGGKSAGGEKCRILQRGSLPPPKAFLERLLRRFPPGPQFPQLLLPFGGQVPTSLPPVLTDGVGCQSFSLDQRQSAGGSGLIDAHGLRDLSRSQVRSHLDELQRGVLRRVDTAFCDHLLVENRHGSGGLPQRRAVAWERLNFHVTEYTCIYIYCQTPPVRPASARRLRPRHREFLMVHAN